MLLVVASADAASKSATPTRAPSLANRMALAFPMPAPAPVTSATLSLTRMKSPENSILEGKKRVEGASSQRNASFQKCAEIIEQKKYTASMFGLAPQFHACGDRMVLVEFAPTISPGINNEVQNLAAALESTRVAGIVEWTPSYCSLGVYYDPLRIGYSQVIERLTQLSSIGSQVSARITRRVEVPVVYGREFVLDLEWVATSHGFSVDEATARHSAAVYRVYLIGFTPGFPYLGGLPQELTAPRLPTQRAMVPAGSVAIGGQQCGIYPVSSPGGWRIIGRTPLHLFNIRHVEPCLLTPGDEVVFRGISEQEFHQLTSEAGAS